MVRNAAWKPLCKLVGKENVVGRTLVNESCCLPGLERDKFDNKTVSFEEHIKSEHNMWHYLYFLVLVRVKDPTEYTGPESYVAQMIAVSTILKT